ncbi:DUF5658 family protein [Chloroflexota bacterium]
MFNVINNDPKTNSVEGTIKTVSGSLVDTQRISGLLGTLFALVVADGIISNFLVAQGIGRELNPFLQTLVGQEAFLLLKVTGAVLSAFILLNIYWKRPHFARIITLCMVAVYTGIMYWNLFVFIIAQI